LIDISRYYLNRLQFAGTDRFTASSVNADGTVRQQRIYSMRPVTVKPRYKNETVPLHIRGAETVIRADHHSVWASCNRDSFVIQPRHPCRGQRADRKISLVIRGQG
jgi:hypothetical protein